jgi:hypothetical protein
LHFAYVLIRRARQPLQGPAAAGVERRHLPCDVSEGDISVLVDDRVELGARAGPRTARG